MHRRKAAASQEPSADVGGGLQAGSAESSTSEAEQPRAWHQVLSVRVIIALLILFLLMHLFLWKVVYDFWMDQNHDRLRATVHEAYNSIFRVLEHL